MQMTESIRALRWGWFTALWIGCGGGEVTTPADPGAMPDPGPEVGSDTGGCHVKEDCPVLPCRLAVCLAGACEYQAVPEGAACSDWAVCVPAGVCDAQGACQGEWACDDGNPCTTDWCEDGACSHRPIEGGPCDDGDPCSEGDLCVSGECKPGKPVCECKDDADCPAPSDKCLGRLMCDPDTKMCVPDPKAKVECPTEDDRPCRKNACDPDTGQCRFVALKDGTACDLGLCFLDETCQKGECTGTEKCASNDPCKVGTCDEENGTCGWENAPDGSLCDDGNPCSTGDHCKGGVCTGNLPAEVCNGADDNCDGHTDPENSNGCITYYYDSDKDGAGDPAKSKCLCGPLGLYSTKRGDDCNDQNPAVHPGATEACNGEDDDCNGVTDGEGSQGCTLYYKDLDEDGAGVTAESKCLCWPTSPYSATSAGDCNDLDKAVYPGAEEVCNQVDDDCDNATDDGEGKKGCVSYWPDQDRDGFGVHPPKCLCHGQGIYTSKNSKDCDDSNPDIHPGKTEVCNGKDDNCDGDTDGGENLGGCKSYYTDPDGDGYGSGIPKCLCKPQGAYVTTKSGDCMEGDPAIHPGGKVCGKDGDCDGKLLDTGEPCDDGNTTTWDGCNGQCAVVEFQVNAYYVGNQWNPDAAFPGTVGDSGYYIAWQGIGCRQYFIPPQCLETEDGIWLRRFDGKGQSMRLELANTYLPGVQGNPAVAASPNGAVVVWDGQGSDTEMSEIYVRRFNSDGSPKDSTATRVNVTTLLTQALPDVVANHSLAFRVVWQTQTSATNTDIVLRAFTDNMTAWSETMVNELTWNHQAKPRIAGFDGQNRFVVVWESYQQTGQEDVYARRFLWGTTALDSPEFLVNDHIAGRQREPSVAGNPSSGGGFVVVWTGAGPGSVGDDIWARVYNADGSPVKYAAVRVNEKTAGDQTQPDVAMASDGSFVVVWFDGADVMLRRFKSDQSPLSPEIVVNQYGYGAQGRPTITGAWNGTVLVAWESDNQDGSEYGIFAQRFGPNGERLFR